MSKTKQENNQPSKYKELDNFELEVICGGSTATICSSSNLNGKNFVEETPAFTKTEGS